MRNKSYLPAEVQKEYDILYNAVKGVIECYMSHVERINDSTDSDPNEWLNAHSFSISALADTLGYFISKYMPNRKDAIKCLENQMIPEIREAIEECFSKRIIKEKLT